MAQKKVRDQPALKRRSWISENCQITVVRQCELVDVCRATVYRKCKPVMTAELEHLQCELIDKEYTRRPFYGSRKMVIYLRSLGQIVNRKRVQRLMRLMGLVAMAPGPNTSQAHPEHKIYPYLLRGVPITRPNQVWSIDITYSTPRQRSPPVRG